MKVGKICRKILNDMTNELIKAIKKVNELNYLSNDYKSPVKEFRNILKEYEKRVSVKISHEIAEFIVFVNGRTTDFLFAEATPGDYLTISFDETDYGEIYFVGHDMGENEPNRILVANSLEELINSMFLKDDE